jgi:ATP adenylyltransferase
MDFIWSPWRYDYITSASASARPPGCVFCIGDDPGIDADRLVVYRGRANFVILNLFPYTSGHLMVVPYAHLKTITDGSPEQLAEMMELGQRAVSTIERLYRPQGFNLGMNLGECAGAGVKDHFHLHVVPRWTGDSNFMTILSETRVLPEDLKTSYARLKAAF